jgi:Na+-transporting NADH:ubiquinone oxidoreductase subunit NqrB
VDWLAGLQPKTLIVALITTVLVLGEASYGVLGGYDRLVGALVACIVTELALSWLVRGELASPVSAYITGVSLAILTKPQANILWPFLLGGFLSIASKYVIRHRGRHLFNPSNFGIGALVLLAPESVAILSQQMGNSLAVNAVIWFFGLVIVTRVGLLHVTGSYVVAFVALAGLRTLVGGGGPFLAEVAPVTGPMYQLFVFFMLTDPRTTVSSKKGRVAVVLIIALVESLIRTAADHGVGFLGPLYYSPPILALFLVGPVAMWIDRHRTAEAGA